MTRLKKLAFNSNYQNSMNYKPEDDVRWSNIFSNLSSLPEELSSQIADALINYSNDRSKYFGEHPYTLCSTIKSRSQFDPVYKLDAQQMTNLTMSIMPEIKALHLGE